MAENSGLDANEILSNLYAENSINAGIDIEEGKVRDVSEDIVDHLGAKQWGIKLASDVAITVLRVDQIIMSKPSGGPNPANRPVMHDD